MIDVLSFSIFLAIPICILSLILWQINRKESPTGWLVGYCALAFLVTLLSATLAIQILDATFMAPVSVAVMGIFVIVACNRWKQDK